jgi:hypothetical protein
MFLGDLLFYSVGGRHYRLANRVRSGNDRLFHGRHDSWTLFARYWLICFGGLPGQAALFPLPPSLSDLCHIARAITAHDVPWLVLKGGETIYLPAPTISDSV